MLKCAAVSAFCGFWLVGSRGGGETVGASVTASNSS